VVFQKRPTFRVHLPNNVAVGAKHKDCDYHHADHEINFWVPLTKAWGNNAMFLESEPNKGDFHCIKPMEFGEVFRFWGNQCYHYNNINDTGSTRVSFDFRVIPYSMFKPKTEGVAVKSGLKFDIGGYYDVCEIGTT